MPHRSQCAVASVIVKPNVAVRPADNAAGNVVCVDEKDWRIVDHLVNAAIPGGDVDHPIAVFADAGHRDSAAHLSPVLPRRSIPFPETVATRRSPDIALGILQYSLNLRRVSGV